MKLTEVHYLAGMRRRLLYEWLTLVGLLAILSILLTVWQGLPGVRDLNRRAYDLSMQAGTNPAASPDIVLITIDDASIDALGYWPWRRSIHAAMLDRLQGARAVGLDLILATPSLIHPEDDAVLADAIRRHGRVILPEILNPDGEHRITPIASLAAAAAGIGRIDALPNPDGTLRGIALRRTPLDGGPLMEHFSLTLARLLGDQAAVARALTLPPDSSTQSLIHFTSPAHRYTTYPYAAVLNGQVPAAAFQNRVVLIGAWATGLGDHLATPLGGMMAGVEILANTLQNLQDDLWIHIAPAWHTILVGLALILLVCLGLGRLSARHGLTCTLIALATFIILDAVLLQRAGYWLPPAGILAPLLLAYPLWSWRSQEATLSRIDRELERLSVPLQLGARGFDSDTTAMRSGPDTLPSRAIRLHQAVSRLRQTTKAQEETLSFLSHDMRSPQTAILSLIELRRQSPDRWTEEAVLEHIERQSRATLNLVDQFVQLSRAESAPLNRHACDLEDLIQECCDRRWPQAAQRSIQLRFEANHPHPAVASIDTELVSRAIGNLLDNALLYSPEGSIVECSLERDGRSWLIHVQDTGPGIPAEQMSRLFTRFHRLPGGAQKPAGSGLGLAFVHAVAQRHGGTASCVSHPGEGARFTISIPVYS